MRVGSFGRIQNSARRVDGLSRVCAAPRKAGHLLCERTDVEAFSLGGGWLSSQLSKVF